MMENLEERKPRYCSDCGLSLVKLDTFCTSRQCADCGKEVFFVRRGEDGGVKAEEGEKLHIPIITFSLDPNEPGRFFRPGFESFLKQLFLENKLESHEIVKRFKEIEAKIDAELNGLDCIQHCNLETEAGVEDAGKILESEELWSYWYNLARSCSLRQCYEAIENGDAVTAAYCCHRANIFKEFSLLEDEHLKEIMWLGYNCYYDLVKNQGSTQESVKEQRLIRAVLPKIKSLESELIYAFINDGLNIGSRVGVNGITEDTLRSLLAHELEQRDKNRESYYKEKDIKIKEGSNKIKIFGFIFTLANALILALYKNWLG